jgi:hypothetical protein
MRKIAATRNYRLVKRADLYIDPDTGDKVFFRALHQNILIAYVNDAHSWKAFIFPVPGNNHKEEVRLYKEMGNPLPEHEARCLWGSVTEDFDNEDLYHR